MSRIESSRLRSSFASVRRFTKIILAFITVILVTGTAYESVAARGDAERFPPRGELFVVDGHRMHLQCAGEGGPVVVLEGGSGGTVLDWQLVQQDLAQITRTCAYDRAGNGWSEPSSLERNPANVATELHGLLHAAGETPPFVMVGASLGGKFIRRFTQQYPDEVAGLVFLDARHEAAEAHMSDGYRRLEGAMVPAFGAAAWFAGRVGYARLLGLPIIPEGLAPEDRDTLSVLGSRPAATRAYSDEYAAQWTDSVDLERESLGDKPVKVLAAGKGGMLSIDGWEDGQRAMAALSTSSELIVLEDSGHAIQFDAPDEVVAAVADVVAATR